jgi:glycosyltransferase involved in cell wall biosynthesis
MMKDPVISVLMITYNHENYIRMSIESVLAQKTNYPIQLIVGEDFSTDKTRIICEGYAYKHPEIIKLLPSKKNFGVIPNLIRTIQACTGLYIAICEGDDYWTDPLKLQKQVDFLEENPEYGMVSTDISLIDKNGNPLPDDNMVLRQREHRKPTVGFFDLLNINLVNTLTVVARAHLLKDLSERVVRENLWFIYDYWFWLNISMHHKIKLFYEKTAAYRVHNLGVSKKYDFFKKRKPLVLRDAMFNAMKHPANNIWFRINVLKCYITVLLQFAMDRNTTAFLLMIKGDNKRG